MTATHPRVPCAAEEALESALRIRIWNECRAKGMAQDDAIRAVDAEIRRIKDGVTQPEPSS